MTDDEILKRADEIKECRRRGAEARLLMNCPMIRVMGSTMEGHPRAVFHVNPSPELAAYLSHVIGCSIMEGAESDEEKDFT